MGWRLRPIYIVLVATLALVGCGGQPTDDSEVVVPPAAAQTVNLLINGIHSGGSILDVGSSFVFEASVEPLQDKVIDGSTLFVFETGFNTMMNSTR